MSSLKDFFDKYIKEVALHTESTIDIKRTWTKRFKEGCNSMDIEFQDNNEVDWEEVEKIIKNARSEATSNKKRSRTSTTSQTSKSGSWELTEEAKKCFKKEYTKMENENKWLVRTEAGRKVYLEDLMYEYGMNCSYEHCVHSFIFDPTDDCWENTLTKKEIEDILKEGNTDLPSLNQSIHDIFNACKKAILPLEEKEEEEDVEEKEYIKCIWKAVTSLGFFDPDVQPDEDWVQRTLLDYLNMYRRNTLVELVANGSEQDFVIRCWSNLDRCFENLGTVARDRTCRSTLVRINSERKITGLKPIEEQHSSIRPDFLVMKDGLDFAVGECGKDDLGGISKKEITERQLHVPKIMKDILRQTMIKFNHDESLLRTLKIGALNQNSTRIQGAVLDCPKGYICRLIPTSEYTIPQSAAMISVELFKIMKLTLQIKNIVKASIKAVTKYQREQYKKQENPTLITQKSQLADTILQIPQTFTIPNTKKIKTSTSDDIQRK
ncbi:hypothetical protein INT45_000359 [Circinella minor]|uniref:Uncharacterized protein n=1 Tax=Circinella minor TaxID=1195481 RepID=A0A8H7S069_9FUNG|nr:hypothetical protein INT45_000359 [Circinella minor]